MMSVTDLPLGRDELWGVTRYRAGGDLHIRPVLWSEMARDTAWATELLGDVRLGVGDIALTTASFTESPAIRAVETAASELGATICPTDAWSFDAMRVAMYVKQLEIALSIGIGREVIDGLRAIGEDIALLGRPRALFARPDAIGDLRDAGLAPAIVVISGPLIAIECSRRTGAHVDPAEWRLTTGPNDEIVATSLRERGLPIIDQPLDLALTLIERDCACGRGGPRLGLRD